MIKTEAEKELGLPYGEGGTALADAVVVGGMYALAAVIPLWPYFFLGSRWIVRDRTWLTAPAATFTSRARPDPAR